MWKDLTSIRIESEVILKEIVGLEGAHILEKFSLWRINSSFKIYDLLNSFKKLKELLIHHVEEKKRRVILDLPCLISLNVQEVKITELEVKISYNLEEIIVDDYSIL